METTHSNETPQFSPNHGAPPHVPEPGFRATVSAHFPPAASASASVAADCATPLARSDYRFRWG
jgi:hypothetical protein